MNPTTRVELAGVALIGAGEVAYDWPTHNWPELPWQLGGFAVLLLAVLLWPYRPRRTHGTTPNT